MRKKYIFVLCPPYQGSTIIVNLLKSSENVSTFLDCGTWAGESQWLYKNHGDKNYEKNRWDENYKLDMDLVDKVFNTYLNQDKKIWVEKSPPMICRAKIFEDYFSKLGDVFFIISIRDPYSTGHYDANHWIKYAKYQKYNLENLNNTILISYEECCNNLEKVISKITNKIPELGQLTSTNSHSFYNERYNSIHSNKVNRVIDKENKNKVLKKNTDLVEYFGYKIQN